ncbi:peptidoglycan DD-metalloendopeptidase family protein [Sphingomonas sp. RB3P16]|uniref:murein hydrolase activator EnvC family protein n=1 Tax=Parasphingomonas frigoris TaxID=3096163 RepID=UPI002FC92ECF
MRGRGLVLAIVAGVVGASVALAQAPTDQRARLAEAKAQSLVAAQRSAALERQAAAEQNQARQAQAREAAIAARVQQAEADIVAGQARLAIIDRLLAEQRGRLADKQAPVARLMGALQSLARRPAIISVVQPGSIDDLVHVRAVLSNTLPVIRARTAAVRADLARTRRLQAAAAVATDALAESRSRLETQRLALTRLEAAHRLRSRALGRDALFESDRAIALGEKARDIVDLMDSIGNQAATRASLEALPGPVPRPPRPGSVLPPVAQVGWSHSAPPYRLPVQGKVVTGLGELSDTGVRSRGLTIVAVGGAQVVAPAAGRVAFAGPFRDYGTIVILDHGGGWTSLVAGLGNSSVRIGEKVAQGAPLGQVAGGEAPRVTIELRRRDRAVDMTALVG